MAPTAHESEPAAPPPAAPEPSAADADAMIASRRYVVLLIVVAIVGVVVSLATWCFLEGIYQIQQELYTHLPHALGYTHGLPTWWPLPILAIAAVIVAVAIRRLPGNGGHIPAYGLAAGGSPSPNLLPGVLLAGVATIASGLVLGPEAPLIVLGSGVALLCVNVARRPFPNQALLVIAAAGSFAAVSFIFESPIIAAIILIEATGIGGARMRIILAPGLLAAGIGTLVSVGMGSFTGLNTSHYALGPLPLSAAAHPDLAEFAWTIALAIAIALVTSVLMRGGRLSYRFVSRRQLLIVLPIAGLIIGGLAIAFSHITGKNIDQVLFDGQDQLPSLISQSSTWSLAALTWLLVFKGVAYSISLGSFRGGPTFPALFLGAAAGLMASHLAGFPLQVAVAVGMGAAVVSVLRLPLSAVVIATLLCSHAGPDIEPLIIVGVVVAYVITLLAARWSGSPAAAPAPATPAPAAPAAEPVPSLAP